MTRLVDRMARERGLVDAIGTMRAEERAQLLRVMLDTAIELAISSEVPAVVRAALRLRAIAERLK